jgi:hypothetical protein
MDQMTDIKRIFTLHYFGDRFSNGRIPVEVLPDLPAFRELLLSYAKDEWRARHPKRKKLPKNFDKELSLSLFEIVDGSAVPQLEWIRNTSQTEMFYLQDGIDEAVEAAYGNVIGLFENSSHEGPPLDPEKLRALNRFGVGLRDQEKIELTSRDGDQNVVSLDSLRRKQLITRGRETYQTRLNGLGELVGTSSPSGPSAQCFIHVQTSEHGTISIPVDRLQLYEEFADSLNSEVQFELLAELDNNDKLRSVVDVYDVATVAGEDSSVSKAKARLEEIGHLADGWHNGEGKAISRISITRALDFVLDTRALGIDLRVYPTEIGGLLIDFEKQGWEYSVEIDSNGIPEMYGIDLAGTSEMEPTPYSDVNSLIDNFKRRLTTDG